MIPKREVNTIAFVQSTEEIAFYGELAGTYKKLFASFKDNSSINEISPALSFLAHKRFKGFARDSFQKCDLIEITE